MARTMEEIVEEINREADRYNELSDLQSNTSRTSVWNFAKKSVAFAVLTLEKIIEKHYEDVNALVEEQEAGSLRWYAQKARSFQYGDRVVVVDNRVKYTQVDPSKQIVKHVSISEGTNNNRGTVYVKALKEENDTLAPLTTDEKNAMIVYMDSIKFAGTKIEIISTDADILKMDLQIEVNNEVIDIAGRLTANSSVSPVIDTIKAYFNNLPFDGIFYLSKLEDQLQAIEGVTDVHIVTAHQKSGGNSYQPIMRRHESTAGYLRLDAENTTITYLNNS